MPPEDLAETWRRCSSRLLLIARAIGEPAEDAVQEAFLQLAKQSPTPCDPFAWLVIVTRNQLLQWRRSGQRRRKREQRPDHRNWFDQDQLQIESSLDAMQVTRELERLDPEQRQVIVMHLWGELSFDQIAEVTGSSRSTAHRTFQSAIKTMRQKFNPSPDPVQPTLANE